MYEMFRYAQHEQCWCFRVLVMSTILEISQNIVIDISSKFCSQQLVFQKRIYIQCTLEV